jgi:hypothetical protein
MVMLVTLSSANYVWQFNCTDAYTVDDNGPKVGLDCDWVQINHQSPAVTAAAI